MMLENGESLDYKLDWMDQRIEANADLATYLATTIKSVVPTLMEMVAQLVEYIDDDELTEIMVAKIGVLRLEQILLQEEE